MSKAEMLRQSAIEKSKSNLEELAEQVQTIRDAKVQSVEELSALLEPLAQALASLSSDAVKTLTEIDRKARETSTSFRFQLDNAIQDLSKATTQAQHAAAGLNQAANRLSWTHFSLAVLTGLVTAVLVSAFWLWFSPPKVVVPMDTKKVVESLTPALIEAMKSGKEPVKPAKTM